MLTPSFTKAPMAAWVTVGLACSLAACSTEVGDTVEGTPGYLPEASGTAGAPVFDDLSAEEPIVDKEYGATGQTVDWWLDVRTGCLTYASTGETVFMAKRQYNRYERYPVSKWTVLNQYGALKVYTLDNPTQNDNNECTWSSFGQDVLKSEIDSNANVDWLMLWRSGGTGNGPNWYVDKVQIHTAEGFRFRCTFNRWVYANSVVDAPCSPY